jgi:hypothetical protein
VSNAGCLLVLLLRRLHCSNQVQTSARRPQIKIRVLFVQVTDPGIASFVEECENLEVLIVERLKISSATQAKAKSKGCVLRVC